MNRDGCDLWRKGLNGGIGWFGRLLCYIWVESEGLGQAPSENSDLGII